MKDKLDEELFKFESGVQRFDYHIKKTKKEHELGVELTEQQERIIDALCALIEQLGIKETDVHIYLKGRYVNANFFTGDKK